MFTNVPLSRVSADPGAMAKFIPNFRESDQLEVIRNGGKKKYGMT
jgi:hypothetical protein